jgi:uncharacterized protein
MKIQLKELFDIIGEKKEIDCVIPLDELKEYSSYSFEAPIAVKGRLENRAGVVTLAVNADCRLNLVCDRCLKEFTEEFCFDFEYTLVRSKNTDNNEYIVCENNVLELNELIISDLLLQLPTKILCKEDCKGLCFVCGQDLNEGSCNCSENN